MFGRRNVSLALVVAVLLASAPALLAASAPPPESVAGPPAVNRQAGAEQTGVPELGWRFETGDAVTNQLIVAGDGVYTVSNDGYLYAVDGATGRERWRVEAGQSAISLAGTTVTDEGVYLADTSGNLKALDLETGRERWSREIVPSEENEMFSTPTVVDGIVYVDDVDGVVGNVYALDAESGELLWQAETGNMGLDSLPVANGLVYVADINGDIFAFDAETGEQGWLLETGEQLSGASPVIDGDALFVSGEGASLIAVDAARGEVLWESQLGTGEENTWSYVHDVADGIVYAGFGTLYGVDAASGSELWSLPVFGLPTIADGVVYVVDDQSRLVAVDAEDGEELWRSAELTGASRTVLADGTLYIGAGAGLLAVDAATGRELWTVRLGGYGGTPVVTEDTVYVGSADRFLYALDRRSAQPPPADMVASEEIDSGAGDLVAPLWLEPMPDAPASVELWELTIEPDERATLPAFPGTTLAQVVSGAVTAPDGLDVVSYRANTEPAETATEGQAISLTDADELELRNEEATPAELLIVSVAPPDEEGVDPDDVDPALRHLGSGVIETLPEGAGGVALRRASIDPETALLPAMTVWPELVVVESGTVDVAVNGESGQLTEGDVALLPAGAIRFGETGDDPVDLLILEINGNTPEPMGAGGCGGRCLRNN